MRYSTKMTSEGARKHQMSAAWRIRPRPRRWAGAALDKEIAMRPASRVASGAAGQQPVDRALGVGEGHLRLLASQYRVLDLRIERVLELRIERQRPVAGEPVGVLELRTQDLRPHRILLAKRLEARLVRRDVAGEQFAPPRELSRPFVAGEMLDESPGQVRVLAALRDAEAVIGRGRPVARRVRDAERALVDPRSLPFDEEIGRGVRVQ